MRTRCDVVFVITIHSFFESSFLKDRAYVMMKKLILYSIDDVTDLLEGVLRYEDYTKDTYC